MKPPAPNPGPPPANADVPTLRWTYDWLAYRRDQLLATGRDDDRHAALLLVVLQRQLWREIRAREAA